MVLIGVDYGSKRVGIAISDGEETFAMPLKIISTGTHLLRSILAEVEKHGARAIVMGYSLNREGRPNMIQKSIDDLKERLHSNGVPVYLQDERFSSQEARLLRNVLPYEKPLEKGKIFSRKPVDASAAAIILQSYIDSMCGKGSGERE